MDAHVTILHHISNSYLLIIDLTIWHENIAVKELCQPTAKLLSSKPVLKKTIN